MKKLFLFFAWIHRIHRRHFGKTAPHWAKDLFRTIKFINFFALLPTVVCIALVPGHFFSRIGKVLDGKSKIHQTPISFFSNAAALMVIFFKAFGYFSPDTDIFKYIVLFSAGLAIIFPVFCLPMLLVFSVWIKSYEMGRKVLVPFNHYVFLIPLSLQTYMRLDFGRYLWSMFYFSIYFLVMSCINLSIIFLILVFFVGASSTGDDFLQIAKLTLIASFLLFNKSIFRQYATLLGCATGYTASTTYKWWTYDVHCLIGKINKLQAMKRNKKKVGGDDFRPLLIILNKRLSDMVVEKNEIILHCKVREIKWLAERENWLKDILLKMEEVDWADEALPSNDDAGLLAETPRLINALTKTKSSA